MPMMPHLRATERRLCMWDRCVRVRVKTTGGEGACGALVEEDARARVSGPRRIRHRPRWRAEDFLIDATRSHQATGPSRPHRPWGARPAAAGRNGERRRSRGVEPSHFSCSPSTRPLELSARLHRHARNQSKTHPGRGARGQARMPVAGAGAGRAIGGAGGGATCRPTVAVAATMAGRANRRGAAAAGRAHEAQPVDRREEQGRALMACGELSRAAEPA